MNVDLAVVREELEGERRAYAQSERAPLDGRVVDQERFVAAQRRRRERIAELEAHEHALVSLEEAAAEIRESWDPEYAALGHTSSATTDRYVGWDTANLEATMRKVLNV